MGFDSTCIEQRMDLKDCIRATNFVSRMMGHCNELKQKYEACIENEIVAKRKKNLEKSKRRMESWNESNKKYGIPSER